MSWRDRLRQRFKISSVGLRPPAARPGRQGVALVAIMRNEAAYAPEWARFHHAAGVRAFFVYDDGSTDGTAEALRAALPEGALTVIPWAQRLEDVRLGREVHNQVLAYAHAASNFGAEFRWMGFLDPDEFLIPVSAPSIPAALEGLDVPSLSLPWHMFGFGGHETAPEGGVLENYTRRAREVGGDAPGLRAFKMLADPCRITSMRVHSLACDGSEATWNDRGDRVPGPDARGQDFVSAERLQLNHYYTRSRAELEAKIARGPNLASKAAEYRRKVMRTVDSIEADTVEDTRARDYAARLTL
ncbi:glycosyltransferase family 2 protein [Jannaschia seohaensis]|uniref:Glycosyl transferase family 2 n=1 Tax=Jannaschia seohaensis TaxID=475081 RepID=A0A2Y9B5R2_9RHOB|nr:glycosyltransferase family 2 protein [Jannaschia seohaensis]PWJ09843.1 glycosyl transferase family 92 [Jannaschia seohaensis]SSA51924.1 Glycosyl transferase family 2 [Jannaschia seohaensis]